MSTTITQTTGKKATGFALLSAEQREQMAKLGNEASRKAGNLGFTGASAVAAAKLANAKRSKRSTPQSGAPAQA